MKSEERIQFIRFPQAGHLDAVRCLLEAQAEVNRSSASVSPSQEIPPAWCTLDGTAMTFPGEDHPSFLFPYCISVHLQIFALKKYATCCNFR